MTDIELDKLIVHEEYRAYLCMMADHGCECVAMTFDVWVGQR